MQETTLFWNKHFAMGHGIVLHTHTFDNLKVEIFVNNF